MTTVLACLCPFFAVQAAVGWYWLAQNIRMRRAWSRVLSLVKNAVLEDDREVRTRMLWDCMRRCSLAYVAALFPRHEDGPYR